MFTHRTPLNFLAHLDGRISSYPQLERVWVSGVLIRWATVLMVYSVILCSGCDRRASSPNRAPWSGGSSAGSSAGNSGGVTTGGAVSGGEEADLELMGGAEVTDMGSVPVDAFVTPPPPSEGERVSLIVGDALVVIWRRGDALWRAQLPRSEIGSVIEDELYALDERRGQRWVSLPEELIDETIELDVSQRHVPYLLVSVIGFESRAISITQEQPEWFPLGLTAPLTIAEGDGGLLVMGTRWTPPSEEDPEMDEEQERAGQDMGEEEESEVRSEETSILAWRFSRQGSWENVVEDQAGLTAITGVTHALGGWVVSSAEGQCYQLNERGGIGASWRCESTANTAMIGGVNSLTHWGALTRSTQDTQRQSGIWLWAGTPGRAHHPYEGSVELLSDPERASSSEAVLSDTATLLIIKGEVTRRLSEGDRPQLILTSEREEAETEISIVVSTQGYGAVPEMVNVDSIIGLLERPQQGHVLILWDETLGAFTTVDISDTWSSVVLPEAPPTDELCLVEAERCDEIDHDCNGEPRNQLCCAQGEISLSRLDDVIFPDLDWFNTDSEVGVLVAVASQNQARLFSMSTAGGESTLRASWSGIERIEHSGNYLSLVALIGRDVDEAPYVLLNRREELNNFESDFIKRPLACEPHAVTVLDESHAVRVYCDEHSILMEVDGEEQIEPYPEAGDLRWATRWMPEGSSDQEVRWLVALGDTQQLSVWYDQGRGGVTYVESDTLMLPAALGELNVDDRALPIQMPPTTSGLLARRIAGQVIEVWIDPLGWTELGGNRWPYWATLSPKRSAAITAGYAEDPRVVGDSFLQRLNLRVHPLTQRGVLLGEELRARISKDSFGGAHFGTYSDFEGTRPNFLTLIGGAIEFSQTLCE